MNMPLTRDFKETVQARALRDPEFRMGLLQEGIECLLAGDLETGKILLRDYVNATIGFEELATLTDKSPKSLMRMLSAQGNPRADNLFMVISRLQEREGVRFELHVVN
jgi:DNA-binding phage protein